MLGAARVRERQPRTVPVHVRSGKVVRPRRRYCLRQSHDVRNLDQFIHG